MSGYKKKPRLWETLKASGDHVHGQIGANGVEGRGRVGAEEKGVGDSSSSVFSFGFSFD